MPRWPDVNPVQWAERCSVAYLQDRGGWTLASKGCHVTPANEMNLEEEGGGSTADWYHRINDWLVSWHDRFLQLVPGIAGRLHFPAFAYGHSDDDDTRGYCGMEICREAISRYAVLDVHPYWFEPSEVELDWRGHRFLKAHALFPNAPIFLSEAGNFNVTRTTAPDEMAQWFRSLSAFPYVLGATPFIFRDPTGAHSPNDWGRNRDIEARIKADIAALVPTTPSHPDPGGPPVPTPNAPSQLGEYARWSLARIQNKEDPRDVTAFVTHLKKLGAEYTKPDQYGLPTVKVTVSPLAA
jgi:hypothetical protein